MFPRLMVFRLPEIWDGFAARLFRCSNRRIVTASSGMQPPSVMDRLFALATRLHTSLFPSADPMTASRPAPRALALPALALLMVAALVAVPDAARAQTPTTTIENTDDEVVLESYDDGALLAPEASSGTGAIPATGAGVRMMWYPGKAAFRVGDVDGSQWDDSNVGDRSVAFGFNTTASGNASTAMGEGTDASGDQSTAMGLFTTASGQWSTAMGYDTNASGEASTAMGVTTTASGQTSTAMGYQTTASGDQSMASGENAAAESGGSFVWNDASGYHAVPNAGDGLSSDKAVSGEPVTGPNTFSVSAQGGVRFITGSSSVTYIDGGTTGWSTTSTRSAKTDVTRADPTAVLEAVEAMPISTWEYKTESGQGAGTRHIGPMAEDFHGALPYDLGSSEDHINALNADGVALGAVKGLARKVERQKEKIAALEAENRDIKERLAALEAEASAAPATAGLMGSPAGSWGLALLLGLGGLAGGILWRRRL